MSGEAPAPPAGTVVIWPAAAELLRAAAGAGDAAAGLAWVDVLRAVPLPPEPARLALLVVHRERAAPPALAGLAATALAGRLGRPVAVLRCEGDTATQLRRALLGATLVVVVAPGSPGEPLAPELVQVLDAVACPVTVVRTPLPDSASSGSPPSPRRGNARRRPGQPHPPGAPQ